MESALQLYIESSALDIPQDFKERFVWNYLHKGEWWESTKAYDEWFNKYYQEYKKFIQGIQRELIDGLDFKILKGPAGPNKKLGERIEYLISFEGLKQLEMKCDKQTRIYYVKLEQLNQQFLEQQQQQIQNENQQLRLMTQEQQAQIQQYEAMKKRGVIYEIYYINDENENYIGSHEGIDPEDRFKTHIQGALQKLSYPLHRRIFREGLKYFKIHKVKDYDYYHADQLKDEEMRIIEETNPALNGGHVFICNCGKELKQEHAILVHRQTCQQYVPKLQYNIQ